MEKAGESGDQGGETFKAQGGGPKLPTEDEAGNPLTMAFSSPQAAGNLGHSGFPDKRLKELSSREERTWGKGPENSVKEFSVKAGRGGNGLGQELPAPGGTP